MGTTRGMETGTLESKMANPAPQDWKPTELLAGASPPTAGRPPPPPQRRAARRRGEKTAGEPKPPAQGAQHLCKGDLFLAHDWLGGRDRGGLGGASPTLSPASHREGARGQHDRIADSLEAHPWLAGLFANPYPTLPSSCRAVRAAKLVAGEAPGWEQALSSSRCPVAARWPHCRLLAGRAAGIQRIWLSATCRRDASCRLE